MHFGEKLKTVTFRRYLHVIRVGCGAFLGGIMILTPECRQPRIAPPRASTINEIKKLK